MFVVLILSLSACSERGKITNEYEITPIANTTDNTNNTEEIIAENTTEYNETTYETTIIIVEPETESGNTYEPSGEVAGDSLTTTPHTTVQAPQATQAPAPTQAPDTTTVLTEAAGAISRERAIAIGYEELARRGYTGTFREVCRGNKRGQQVWEVLYRVEGGRKPLVEMYIAMDNGTIVKFEWDD